MEAYVAAEPSGEKQRPEVTPAELREAAALLHNPELLGLLDVVLLELEKRLLHYAHVGPELVEMADEGLVLAAKAGARLRQTQSSISHATGHLQVVGVGEWSPKSTNPSWSDDPRVTGQEE
jgi:hypothetical protein